MKERHWMGAGEAMERMRRRLCINLGKNAELGKEEDKTKPLSFFFFPYFMQFHTHTQIKSLHYNKMIFHLCCTCKGAENGHACSDPRELTWN